MGTIMATSENFQFHIQFKTIEKNKFYYRSFSSSLSMEHIKIYRFHLRNCLYSLYIQTRRRTRIFGAKMTTFWKFPSTYNSKPLKKDKLEGLSFKIQSNSEAYPIVKISSSKLRMFSHACSREEQIFSTKMATSGKFHSTYNSKALKKRSSFIDLSVSV